MNLKHLNLTEYPIDKPDSNRYLELVKDYRARLNSTGLITLEGFLSPAGVDAFRQSVYERAPTAYHSVHGAQGYFDRFPFEYPRGVVGSDTYCMGHHLLHDTPMDALYRWRLTREFIAALTGNNEVYLHEDPANAVVVQLYRPDSWTGWHFDRALFTTIVNLGEPTGGGILECAPDVRTEDDPGYEAVRDVLNECSDRVERHRMTAGSLTLMLGRYSMHRVTRVEPGADRISLVLKYETQPGTYISAADRKWIFGPSAPSADGASRIADN